VHINWVMTISCAIKHKFPSESAFNKKKSHAHKKQCKPVLDEIKVHNFLGKKEETKSHARIHYAKLCHEAKQ